MYNITLLYLLNLGDDLLEHKYERLEILNFPLIIDKNEINKIVMDTIMNNSQDTFYFKDKQSRIIVSNKAHSILWGEENPKKVVGKTDFDYFPEEFSRDALAREQEIMRTGKSELGIIEKLIKPDGKIIWLSASKYPLYDGELNIIGTWGTSRDITTLKETELELARLNKSLEEANEKLQVLSSKDSLTGLYNHGYFMEETAKVFDLFTRRKDKNSNESFSIIILDVDDLKVVNDTYGHLMGDCLLKDISNKIYKRVRSSDKFFRIGGDEFGLLLLDTNLEEAKVIAEDIRALISKTNINFMDNDIKSTISIGVSSFNEADNIRDMIHLADERLYISKREGKNRIY